MWPTNVQGWITLAVTALGVISTVSGMVSMLLSKYKKTLQKSTDKLEEVSRLLKEQQDINQAQAEAVELSLKDRGEIKETLDRIAVAQQTQMQIEISKISDRALSRGKITCREKAQLGPLWEAYKSNGWNHIERGRVVSALELPLAYVSEDK